jgi:UDP-3-O-[3-hydroxymyristoyl] glucosamine N-acyltransferase
VSELAERLGGEAFGEVAREIRDVAPFDQAGPEHLCFAAEAGYLEKLEDAQAGCVIVPEDFEVPRGLTGIWHRIPKVAFATALPWFRAGRPKPPRGVHATAHVDPTAKLAESAAVGPNATIEAGAVIGADVVIYGGAYVGPGAQIGEGSSVHPNAVIGYDVRIGAGCRIHAGAVIGGDGFGYHFDPEAGRHVKIPQLGTVVLEDEVDVGASTTIDRAVLGETRIGRGTKIDNQVQIGHNVTIGPNSIVVAQVGISGSTTLGAGVVVAAQAGIVDHVTIGDGAVVCASAGVTKDVPPGEHVLGQPAIPLSRARRAYALIGRLPDLRASIRRLEKAMKKEGTGE